MGHQIIMGVDYLIRFYTINFHNKQHSFQTVFDMFSYARQLG